MLQLSGGLALATACRTALAARAEPEDGEDAHPTEAPTLKLSLMTFERTAMYGRTTVAVVGIPKSIAEGERLPLVVLLPGGHHTMQQPDRGCWGWWSEYQLGELDAALRRGRLTSEDFFGLARPHEREAFNGLLASKPYRGAIFVTPWVVGRQLQPAPHGAMVTTFLRQLVERARVELPVLASRDATGLGGMSSGGLWTLYCGSACADLFGTIVATQPFTEDLVAPISQAMFARPQAQRVRLVSSAADHQLKSTRELSEVLAARGFEHEMIEYLGAHSATFAAGIGGLDALLTFDRALRGEAPDGTRPLPAQGELPSVSLGRRMVTSTYAKPAEAVASPQKTLARVLAGPCSAAGGLLLAASSVPAIKAER